jgi:hypothetical protein
MYMPTYSHVGHSRPTDEGLERLRRDLLNVTPLETDEVLEPVNYAALEFELERLRKRLGIWQIFMTHMKDGADTWSQVHDSLTQSDYEQIVEICDGASLRDLLLDEG